MSVRQQKTTTERKLEVIKGLLLIRARAGSKCMRVSSTYMNFLLYGPILYPGQKKNRQQRQDKVEQRYYINQL